MVWRGDILKFVPGKPRTARSPEPKMFYDKHGWHVFDGEYTFEYYKDGHSIKADKIGAGYLSGYSNVYVPVEWRISVDGRLVGNKMTKEAAKNEVKKLANMFNQLGKIIMEK